MTESRQGTRRAEITQQPVQKMEATEKFSSNLNHEDLQNRYKNIKNFIKKLRQSALINIQRPILGTKESSEKTL